MINNCNLVSLFSKGFFVFVLKTQVNLYNSRDVQLSNSRQASDLWRLWAPLQMFLFFRCYVIFLTLERSETDSARSHQQLPTNLPDKRDDKAADST